MVRLYVIANQIIEALEWVKSAVIRKRGWLLPSPQIDDYSE